jgi:hypothetical protein
MSCPGVVNRVGDAWPEKLVDASVCFTDKAEMFGASRTGENRSFSLAQAISRLRRRKTKIAGRVYIETRPEA